MPVYADSDQLYTVLKILFGRVQEKDATAAETVIKSKLIMRMRTSVPMTEVCLNGRKNPLLITYGASPMRPDIELELPADLLHQILLSQITLRKAYSTGKIKLRGPIWKAFVFDRVFQVGQLVYPQVLREQNIDGYHQ